MTNDGGPAFPHYITSGGQGGAAGSGGAAGGSGGPGALVAGGMTLRDYFAAAALQALITDDTDGGWTLDGAASRAYRFSDAMLAERAK